MQRRAKHTLGWHSWQPARSADPRSLDGTEPPVPWRVSSRRTTAVGREASMTDQTTGAVRPEAEAIEAMQALVEGARRGAANLGALLATVLDNGPSEAAELLGRAGQAI